jgi:hypothetical protein
MMDLCVPEIAGGGPVAKYYEDYMKGVDVPEGGTEP